MLSSILKFKRGLEEGRPAARQKRQDSRDVKAGARRHMEAKLGRQSVLSHRQAPLVAGSVHEARRSRGVGPCLRSPHARCIQEKANHSVHQGPQRPVTTKDPSSDRSRDAVAQIDKNQPRQREQISLRVPDEYACHDNIQETGSQ